MSEAKVPDEATETVYVLVVEERSNKPDMGYQIRVYSDRYACLDDCSQITGNEHIWWSMTAVAIDNHQPWVFAVQPRQAGLEVPS